jgi:hypothetical protein
MIARDAEAAAHAADGILREGEQRMPPGAICGPSAWYGPELAQRDNWIVRLSSEDHAEIDRAVAAFQASGVPLTGGIAIFSDYGCARPTAGRCRSPSRSATAALPSATAVELSYPAFG